LDVCGTGGDRLNTFNISTTVALLVSAAGVTVAKHGNRAVTSSSGSADVLAALGVAIELTPEAAGEWLKNHHFAFFFAPRYHPAFRNIAPARALCAQQGRRTVFNILGPLLNPAHPRAQIIGVPAPELCEPMARVLCRLGVEKGLVVSGQAEAGWMDEISILGATTAAGYGPGREVSSQQMDLSELPLKPATVADLAGGDARNNAEVILGILQGRDHGPRRAAAQVNSAAALWIAGQVKSLRDGWEIIEKIIDEGIGLAHLERLRQASV
jgi:anthranilate phosphoribosyltransferase